MEAEHDGFMGAPSFANNHQATDRDKNIFERASSFYRFSPLCCSLAPHIPLKKELHIHHDFCGLYPRLQVQIEYLHLCHSPSFYWLSPFSPGILCLKSSPVTFSMFTRHRRIFTASSPSLWGKICHPKVTTLQGCGL